MSSSSSSSSTSDDDEQDEVINNDVMITEPNNDTNPLPSRVIITVGTYDGVVAGWELLSSSENKQKQQSEDRKLKITFASPVHGGSVRSLCLACAPPNNKNNTAGGNTPGSLLSTGYDEMLKTHDYHRRLTSSGEVRTPADFGTPVCSSFAPPAPTPVLFTGNGNTPPPPPQSQTSTHCIIGFSSGKLVIYKKRDWTIQHVLAGHSGNGGISALAVHPTGKLALTGGAADGKLKLWDLTKGRLSFVTKIASGGGANNSRRIDPIVDLVWSQDGTMYGYCHGSHITVRDVATGKDWCDVELPSRVNQIALLQGPEGIFVAAACNDGSLPVLAVQLATNDNNDNNSSTDDEEERRAVMAIEPVEGPVAGEERYKCIQTITGYYVATANSAGVISLMNLQGAINMIMTPTTTTNPAKEEAGSDDDDGSSGSRNSEDDEDDDDDEEMAVDIIDAVQLGSGARVTCLVTWASSSTTDDDDDDKSDEENRETTKKQSTTTTTTTTSKEEDDSSGKKRKQVHSKHHVEMDPKEIEKARELVAKAKKMQQKKRKDSHSPTSSSSSSKKEKKTKKKQHKENQNSTSKRQKVNPPGE